MQERHVAGIDAAFHRLQPVAFLETLGREGLRPAARSRIPTPAAAAAFPADPCRSTGCRRARPADTTCSLIFLAEAAALPAPTARRRIGRSRRISSRDRGSGARTPRCGRTTATRRDARRTRRSGRSALGVAKGEQTLGQQLHTHRRAVVLRQLLGQQRRNPVAAEHPAHRRAGPRLGQQIVSVRS